MGKYKVSELAEVLGVSEPAIRKKMKRGDYETVEETINNRLVTHIILSDSKLEELKKQVVANKNTYKIVDQTSVESIPSSNTTSDKVEEEQVKTESFDKLIEFTERYIERLENLYDTNAEQGKKLFLLEDKQREQESSLEYYKAEYFKLQQENEKLNNLNETLEQKLNSLAIDVERLSSKNQEEKRILGNTIEALEDKNKQLEEEIIELEKPWYKRKRK